ncbi:AMP-binding protein [Chlamydia sp. 17-3921]|uniref:AMP-binding protein n=1 Tax=Chlamydia sp. 17-3921 TaxID=2675798 RepID=UPI00191885AD|nr:AMP-binding protein [Chlamydia sp. 17-3921]
MQNSWNTPNKSRDLQLRSENSVLENFLMLCSQLTSHTVCFDEYLGTLTYTEMHRAVVALAIKISQYPELHIGIMMPSSVGAYIAYFATLLARKIPVMINWSQGLREIRICANLAEVQRVLTSIRLIEHLSQAHGILEYPFELIYIEELKKQFSWWEKCRIGVYSKFSPSWLMKVFGVKKSRKYDVAVILFTSGAEQFPKGVPLTHENLIENQKACIKFFDPNKKDVMLSFLPPFHAYGFNSCSLCPLLTGIPIVFASNPLNPKKLVELIESKKVSIIGATPIFFDYILKTAKKQESNLSSLRLVVIGGDSLKDSLRAEVKTQYPHIVLHQGYGATECSPVITITTQASPKVQACVGSQITGMDVVIVSKDTHVPVSSGESGMIVVRGSSVFSGYLQKDPSQGFISLGGERWYVTGDLGYIGVSGDLFLLGRLSRFVKIGGEMVSLEALECILRQGLPGALNQEQATTLTVCEIPGDKVKLCLFTTFPTNIHEVNDVLKNAETSNIVKVSFIHQIETIPLLGIGKPSYASLKALAISLFG